jgi:hypothetical protein
VEYSFQSEHLVSHCFLFLCLCWLELVPLKWLSWRETLATRLLVVRCLAKPWIARWWPSVQKAKIAGQPTSSLLLRWWWSWKVLAMRTLRANLRAHLNSLGFAYLFVFRFCALALELCLFIFFVCCFKSFIQELLTGLECYTVSSKQFSIPFALKASTQTTQTFMTGTIYCSCNPLWSFSLIAYHKGVLPFREWESYVSSYGTREGSLF